MKFIFRRLVCGARYSEKYGNHPGTAFLLFFVAVGGLAGLSSGGVSGLVFGSFLMFLFFVPLWLVGCWSRGDM